MGLYGKSEKTLTYLLSYICVNVTIILKEKEVMNLKGRLQLGKVGGRKWKREYM